MNTNWLINNFLPFWQYIKNIKTIKQTKEVIVAKSFLKMSHTFNKQRFLKISDIKHKKMLRQPTIERETNNHCISVGTYINMLI